MYKRFLLILLLVFVSVRWVFAEVNCDGKSGDALFDCLSSQIGDLNKSLEMSVAATKPLESEISKLSAKIKQIQGQINEATKKQKQTEIDIKIRGEKVAEQYEILSVKLREMYKRLRSRPLWANLVANKGLGEIRRELAYRQDTNDKDRQVIVSLVNEISSLEDDKKKLEVQRQQLAKLQTELDKQNNFFLGEVKKAKAYQSDLTNKIAQLSSKQQQLLAEKLGSLNLPTSLGGGSLSCVDDRKIDPGFGNGFAFFTYGIPHRVGMDQYGANGRAKAGQSAEDILKAYFDNFEFITGKEGETVKVNGKNEFGQTFNNESMNIEEYLKHLHEMPPSWDNKALEAQAIAARSYALFEQKSKGFLYPSQQDQVVKKEINSQRWIDAVNATKGKIIAQGGNPVKAWYASTSGGYTFNSGDIWSRNTSHTKRLRDANGDVSGFGDLQGKAYGKDSPCFYSAQGYRSAYNKSAWLKSEEVADIVNVLMLAQNDSGTQKHLSQPDKPNPDGDETWNQDKVKEELKTRKVNPYSTISSVSVSVDFGIGKVTTVSISGDAGSKNFSANEFINYFNLRAPANIQIVGPLFNVEKR